VDWQGFSIHGIAVHDALIELVLPDSAKRTRAFQTLEQHIKLGGQGLKHAALPFLVRLATDTRVDQRGNIIRFLCTLLSDGVVLASVIENIDDFTRCLDFEDSANDAVVLLALCGHVAPLVALAAGPPRPVRTLALWCLSTELLDTVDRPTDIEQVILWMAHAEEHELPLAIRRELESVAADTFFKLQQQVDTGDGFFSDLITRIQRMQPKSRWSMLEGILFGVEQGVAIDVLTSRMIDVFLPATAHSFEELPYEARLLVSRFAASRQTWSGSQMQRKLKLAGLPHQRSKVVEELARFGLVEVIVLIPEMYKGAEDVAESLDTAYWRGTPFLFFSGDTSQLDIQIPEDPSDFPEHVMHNSGQVAGWLYSAFVHDQAPRLRHVDQDSAIGRYRFYPRKTRDRLLEICAKNHWRVLDIVDQAVREPSAVDQKLRSHGWEDLEFWEADSSRIFAKLCKDDENAWLSIRGDIATLALGDESITESLMIILEGELERILEVVTAGPMRRTEADRLISLAKARGLRAGLRLSKKTVLQF
jgi:hypothetical protein